MSSCLPLRCASISFSIGLCSCGMLSISIIKRVKRPRVKLGKRAKLSRAKLASRRNGTRPTGPRQTGTRQKGRAKLDWQHLYSCMNWGIGERTKMPNLWNSSEGDSNPRSLDWESGILLLRYCALHQLETNNRPFNSETNIIFPNCWEYLGYNGILPTNSEYS